MTETDPGRGGECPPWCQRDHRGAGGAHIRQTGSITLDPGGYDAIWACAILGEQHGGRPSVAVTGARSGQDGSPQVDVPAHRAGGLAALVDMLAGATPEQHRALARAITRAAAAVTGDTAQATEATEACDAGRPDLTGGVTIETEWGVRYSTEGWVQPYVGGEGVARSVAGDRENPNGPGILVRRTVTYGPWEEVPGA